MTELFLIWDEGSDEWNTTSFNWDEIRFIEDNFIAIDGAGRKTPLSKIDIKKKLKTLTPVECDKLIKIYLKVYGEEIEKVNKDCTKIKVTVSEVEEIVKKVLNVKISL